MALDKFNWQNGSQVEPAKVEIEGVSYDVVDAQYEGETPLSASNLNLMQDTILGNVVDTLEDDTKIPSVKAIKDNKTYVYGAQNTISFTAPYSGIIDIEYSISGWGYNGGEYKPKIENTVGNATQLAYAEDISHKHDTASVPVKCRAFYRVEKNVEYTFVGSQVGANGGRKSEWMMAKLTP